MRTFALSQPAVEESLKSTKQTARLEQYSLGQILGVLASVALPMGLIFWMIILILGPRLDANPGMLYYILVVPGLSWQ